jgi:molybdopterin synthase catalytic subunit
MRILITPAPFSPEAELRSFAQGRDGDVGAMASFVGYCRASSEHGEVRQLELEHYPGFTEAEVTRFAVEIVRRHQLMDLLVIHRVGVLPAREPIVLVAALSAHRAAAFSALSELMDFLKTDAPFWKRETGPGGSRWIDPTAADYARRKEHMR